MPTIGPVELVIILVIALLVIGPGKLPDVGAALGRSIREFRKAASDVQEAVKLDGTSESAAPAAPPPAPAAPAMPASVAPAVQAVASAVPSGPSAPLETAARVPPAVAIPDAPGLPAAPDPAAAADAPTEARV